METNFYPVILASCPLNVYPNSTLYKNKYIKIKRWLYVSIKSYTKKHTILNHIVTLDVYMLCQNQESNVFP